MAEKSYLKERIEYLDLFRAFGIILMIMGHIKFGGFFDKWIHAFHMPMFFFISGWFFKTKENVGAQIRKKTRSLLLPYIFFELTLWVLLMLFVSEYRSLLTLQYIFTENTYKIPIDSGTFGISPIPGAMWFLTAIFFSETIYILIDKILGCDWKLHIVVALLVVVGMLSPAVLPSRLPWALDAAFVGTGFFHIARMIKGSKAEKILNLKLWQTLLIGAVISGSIMVCPKINMRTGNYGWYFTFWINALAAIVVGWNISRYVGLFFANVKALSAISEWLNGVGRNSIIYLCLNQVVILVVTKLFDMIGFKGLIVKIPIFILTMVILFGFEKIICNTKLKVIIGK